MTGEPLDPIAVIYRVWEMYRTLNRTGWFEGANYHYWKAADGPAVGELVEDFVCQHMESLDLPCVRNYGIGENGSVVPLRPRLGDFA